MKRYFWTTLFAVLTLLNVIFIFSNSAQSAQVSSQRSDAIVDLIKGVVDSRDRIPRPTFVFLVRKAAHFSEFAALGFCLTGLSVTLRWKKRGWRMAAPAVTALVLAVADECSQFFSDGRSPGLKDVGIDFAGAVFGVFFTLGAFLLIQRFRRRGEDAPR